MSPIGHTVTAFAMAITYMRISDVSWGLGFSSLLTVIMSGNLVNIDHAAFVTLVALGMRLGARGPDRLEIPRFNKRTQTRRSVIPHRTLTHWPPLWVAMTAICWTGQGNCRRTAQNSLGFYHQDLKDLAKEIGCNNRLALHYLKWGFSLKSPKNESF